MPFAALRQNEVGPWHEAYLSMERGPKYGGVVREDGSVNN